MTRRTERQGSLVEAAGVLEDELRAFEDSVGAFQKLALSSKKNLDRGKTMLEDLANAEARLGEKIQMLVAAITQARERQHAQLEAVKAKALELKDRAVAYQELTAELEALGVAAGELNARLQGTSPAVVDVGEALGRLSAQAQALFARAKERKFDDIAHLADALDQQLAALRGKLDAAGGASDTQRS